MPAAPVYVAAILATVAAAVAFKEFVYDPHIAPTFERWIDEVVAHERARRQRVRSRARSMMVSSSVHSDSDDDEQGGQGSGDHHQKRAPRAAALEGSAIELEKLVARELEEWRTGTGASTGEHPGLRRRHRGPMDESITDLPVEPISPDAAWFSPASSSMWVAAADGSPSLAAHIQPVAALAPIAPPSPRALHTPSPSDWSSTVYSVSSRSTTPEIMRPQPLVAVAAAAGPAPAIRPPSPLSRTLSPFSEFGASAAGAHSPAFSSLAGSRAHSPSFSEYAAPAAVPDVDPGVAMAAPFVVHHDFDVLSVSGADSDSDDELFSFAGSVAPSVLADDDDDLSDLESMPGSEISGWSNVSSASASRPAA